MLLSVHGDGVHPFELNPYRKRPDPYGSQAIEAEYHAKMKAKQNASS